MDRPAALLGLLLGVRMRCEPSQSGSDCRFQMDIPGADAFIGLIVEPRVGGDATLEC